jgi:hypothetical protein
VQGRKYTIELVGNYICVNCGRLVHTPGGCSMRNLSAVIITVSDVI